MQGEGAPLSCMGEAGKEAGRPAEEASRNSRRKVRRRGGGWLAGSDLGCRWLCWQCGCGRGSGVQGRAGGGVFRKLMPASRREMMVALACLVQQEWGQCMASWLSGFWGLMGCGVS